MIYIKSFGDDQHEPQEREERYSYELMENKKEGSYEVSPRKSATSDLSLT